MMEGNIVTVAGGSDDDDDSSEDTSSASSSAAGSDNAREAGARDQDKEGDVNEEEVHSTSNFSEATDKWGNRSRRYSDVQPTWCERPT